ncbi:MAG: hypothetical protein J6M18_02505 [Actinomycetaceae bacterium]|nr:hypothetical protein [Actinomycetaceae bacterium]
MNNTFAHVDKYCLQRTKELRARPSLIFDESSTAGIIEHIKTFVLIFSVTLFVWNLLLSSTAHDFFESFFSITGPDGTFSFMRFVASYGPYLGILASFAITGITRGISSSEGKKYENKDIIFTCAFPCGQLPSYQLMQYEILAFSPSLDAEEVATWVAGFDDSLRKNSTLEMRFYAHIENELVPSAKENFLFFFTARRPCVNVKEIFPDSHEDVYFTLANSGRMHNYLVYFPHKDTNVIAFSS